MFLANSEANASEKAASIPAGAGGMELDGNVDVGGGAEGTCGDLRELGEVEERGAGLVDVVAERVGLADVEGGEGLLVESNWSRTSVRP